MHLFKKTGLRLAKGRLEQRFRLLLSEGHPESWGRFAEMDVTDLRANGGFVLPHFTNSIFFCRITRRPTASSVTRREMYTPLAKEPACQIAS